MTLISVRLTDLASSRPAGARQRVSRFQTRGTARWVGYNGVLDAREVSRLQRRRCGALGANSHARVSRNEREMEALPCGTPTGHYLYSKSKNQAFTAS